MKKEEALERINKSEKEQMILEREIYRDFQKKGKLSEYYLLVDKENSEKRKQAISEIRKLMRDIPPSNAKDIQKIVRIVSVRCDLPNVYVSKLIPKRRKNEVR